MAGRSANPDVPKENMSASPSKRYSPGIESAAKLRLVFDAMRTARGVYLFDEVDALATRRGSENDVGEARRVLNSLLQFLDEDETASVVVSTRRCRTRARPPNRRAQSSRRDLPCSNSTM